VTPYEQGFAVGERQAFKDRRDHIVRPQPNVGNGEYLRGWRDGYTPRSVTWAIRGTEPAAAWWQERESEAA
jgi:hypothetical protein